MRFRRVAFVVASAAIAASGCGGGDPEPAVDAAGTTTSATPTPTVAADTTTVPPPPPVTLDSAGTVTVLPTTVAEPTSVIVVGDSLTVAASELIGVALDSIGADVVAIDAVESRRMTGGSVQPGVDAIDELVAAGSAADVWVIALGTNDVGAEVKGDAAAEATRAVLDRVPAGVRIVWVNAYIRNRAGDAALFNSVVRDVVESRGDSTIVDWFASGDDDGVISNDGVHLTDLGEARFAASIAAGVIAVT